MAVKYNGIEKYIWSDTYNLFLKHYNGNNSDEEWQELIKDAEDLNKKYHNHPVARQIIVQTILIIESRVTGRYLDGKSYRQWENELSHIINPR